MTTAVSDMGLATGHCYWQASINQRLPGSLRARVHQDRQRRQFDNRGITCMEVAVAAGGEVEADWAATVALVVGAAAAGAEPEASVAAAGRAAPAAEAGARAAGVSAAADAEAGAATVEAEACTQVGARNEHITA